MAKLDINKDYLAKLRASVNIHDVVLDRIGDAKRTKSDRMNIACPFHGSSNPTMGVNASSGSYKCWSCEAAGDAISFVMDYDDIDFPSAVTLLAKEYAHMPEPEPEKKQELTDKEIDQIKLNRALNNCTEAFSNQLVTSPVALSYLNMRGIDAKTAHLFKLGFIDGRSTADVASTGTKAEDMDGLRKVEFIKPSRDGELWSPMGGRLLFPIRNTQGSTVGFSARRIQASDSGAKYINSSESDVYHKSKVLYGLHESLQHYGTTNDSGDFKPARRLPVIYVVEGQTDVIKMLQHGIGATVASSGTTLSTDQIHQLMRFTDHICFVFDSDEAGHKAAIKAARKSCEHAMPDRRFSFIQLPEGADPDSLLSSDGGKEWILKEIGSAASINKIIASECVKASKQGADSTARKGALIAEASDWLKVTHDKNMRVALSLQLAEAFKVPLSSILPEATAEEADLSNYESAVRDDLPLGLLHIGLHCPSRRADIAMLSKTLAEKGSITENWLPTIIDSNWTFSSLTDESVGFPWSKKVVANARPFGTMNLEAIATAMIDESKKKLGLSEPQNTLPTTPIATPATTPAPQVATRPPFALGVVAQQPTQQRTHQETPQAASAPPQEPPETNQPAPAAWPPKMF